MWKEKLFYKDLFCNYFLVVIILIGSFLYFQRKKILMKIREQDGIYYTSKGLELLTQEPHFVEKIWNNDAYRNHWQITSSGQELTKIHYKNFVMVEKTGSGKRDLDDYIEVKKITNQFNHIHIPTLYMATVDKLLMKFYDVNFDRGGAKIFFGSMKVLKKVKKEYELFYEQAMDLKVSYLESGILPNGDILILDPHL